MANCLSTFGAQQAQATVIVVCELLIFDHLIWMFVVFVCRTLRSMREQKYCYVSIGKLTREHTQLHKNKEHIRHDKATPRKKEHAINSHISSVRIVTIYRWKMAQMVFCLSVFPNNLLLPIARSAITQLGIGTMRPPYTRTHTNGRVQK